MRTVDFWLRVLSCWVIFLLGTMMGAWAEEPSRFFLGEGHSVGVVMGISGGPVSIVSAGLASRIVKMGDLMAAGDEISTDPVRRWMCYGIIARCSPCMKRLGCTFKSRIMAKPSCVFTGEPCVSPGPMILGG